MAGLNDMNRKLVQHAHFVFFNLTSVKITNAIKLTNSVIISKMFTCMKRVSAGYPSVFWVYLQVYL